MKRQFLVLFIFVFISCNPDSTDDEQKQEKLISYNLSVITLTDEITKEFDILRGMLVNLENPTNLSTTLNLTNGYRFKVEGTKFTAWHFMNGPVWNYNVRTKEFQVFSDYFDLGEDYIIYNPCTVPAGEKIITFFQTDDDPFRGEYSQAEIYDSSLNQRFTIDFPFTSTNCIGTFKLANDNLLMHLVEEGSDYFWNITDLNKYEFVDRIAFFDNRSSFVMDERRIIFLNFSSTTGYTTEIVEYDIEKKEFSSPVLIYNSPNSTNTELSFLELSYYLNKAQIINDKMLFLNFPKDRGVIQVGNIDQAFGPAILDLKTGELRTFSAQKMHQEYYALYNERPNIQLLQSVIDLKSETIVVSCYIAGYEKSPYGILYFDFDLNLIKSIDLGNNRPIELIKY